MSPLGLLSHLSPSTIGMLASPPKLPSVPTLADLQRRADEMASSLPSYADLRGGSAPVGTGNGAATATGKASAPSTTPTGPTLSKPNPKSVPTRTIPRVNLDPNAVPRTEPVFLPGQGPAQAEGEIQTQGQGGGSWFSTWLGGVGSSSSSSSGALTIPPPPSYAITDPRPRGQVDASAAMQGTQSYDQGRTRLIKMRDGHGRLQGEIPGEASNRTGGYTDLQIGLDSARDEKRVGRTDGSGWWWKW